MHLLHYDFIQNKNSQAPVLVFLHGLFGSSTNWQSIARSLVEEYSVVLPDLRNHGASFHCAEMSYSDMAGDVWRLLDHLGIDFVVMIGHSMGGKVAMTMALQQPHRIAGLAVVDIAPVAYRHDFNDVFRAFDAVELSELKSRRMADEQMAQVIDNPALRGFLLQNLQRKNDHWQWRINLAVLQKEMSNIVGFTPNQTAYKGVTTFISGSKSDYVLPQYKAVTALLFPHSHYCQVQNAGHWVYAEQPKAFMRCLQRFLAKID